MTAEEVPAYKQGNGESEWRGTCPRSLSEYALGFEPDFFCLQFGLLHHYYTVLSDPAGTSPSPSEGHPQNLFMLGIGKGNRERKYSQLVLPGPNQVILVIKRESVPPRVPSAAFSSASSALSLLLTTRSEEAEPMSFAFLYPFCVQVLCVW